MVINHRFSKLFCALALLVFSASAYAAEYSSLSTCREDFYKTNPVDIPAADAFCKPKMDPIVFCTQQAVSAERQLPGSTHLNAVQLEAVNVKYRNLCIASGGASVSVNTASASSTASPYALPSNTFGIQQPADPSAAIAACGANATCVQMRQAEFAELSKQYAARVATAQQAQSQPQNPEQQAQNGAQSNPMAAVADIIPMVIGGMGQQQQPQPQASVANPVSASAPAMAGNFGAQPNAAPIVVGPELAAKIEAAPRTGVAANGELGAARAKLDNVMPEEVLNRQEEAPNAAATAPPDPVTVEESGTNTTEFQKQVDEALKSHASSFRTNRFAQTAAALSMAQIRPIVDRYEQESKKACETQSGKTETLCVEQSSPGAQAARALMDAAGPIMMMMNSAQKACSSTSKVANLAALGLTAANGVCVASKMKCEKLCKATVESLATFAKEAKDKADAGFAADFPAKKAECDARTPPANTQCLADLERIKTTNLEAAKTAIDTAFKKQEEKATPGTPAEMQAKCEKKIRNIIGMLANIGALLTAKKSGEDCEKKLAANGQAGNALSTQQYCEQPGNNASQFCKCQNGSTAAGCPNSQLIAAPGEGESGKNPNDVAGSNIRPTSGASGFAGGGMGGPIGTGADFRLGGAGGVESDNSNPFGPRSSGAAAAGGAGGGAGALGGGPGGGAAGAEAAGKKKEDGDDKKFSFGALAAGVSSMFGGGGKGGNGNGDLKNTNPALEANIQRKIASDRLGMEVTPASGVSNWEKVHKTIIRVENTLIRGNGGGM